MLPGLSYQYSLSWQLPTKRHIKNVRLLELRDIQGRQILNRMLQSWDHVSNTCTLTPNHNFNGPTISDSSLSERLNRTPGLIRPSD